MSRPAHTAYVPHARAVLRTAPHERPLSTAAQRFAAQARTAHVAHNYRGAAEAQQPDHGGWIAPDEALAKSAALFHAQREAERTRDAAPPPSP